MISPNLCNLDRREGCDIQGYLDEDEFVTIEVALPDPERYPGEWPGVILRLYQGSNLNNEVFLYRIEDEEVTSQGSLQVTEDAGIIEEDEGEPARNRRQL